MLDFVKKHWLALSVGVGVALVVLSAAAVFMIFGERKSEIANVPANTPAPATQTAAVKTWNDLYAVSIDNMFEARPLSGVDKAVFVIEAPVEGGMSRLLAFFERGNPVPQIGPVRSARLYFLDWIRDAGPALFLHIGGSPEAIAKINSDTSLLVTDADGIGAAGVYFSRDSSREAPHNAYVASKDVETVFWKRSQTPRPVTGWTFIGEPDPAKLGNGGDIKASWGEATNNVVWKYDKTVNAYGRWVNGKADATRDKAAITAKNVVLMYTDVATIDEEGRKSVRTTGEGTAKIFMDGNETDGKWKCDGQSLPRFYDADGNEIVFIEGNVWIEVLGS